MFFFNFVSLRFRLLGLLGMFSGGLVVLFSLSVLALGPINLAPHFRGTCTVDYEFCAFFAPTDLPAEAVAAYMNSAQKSIRIASYNFSMPGYAEILNQKARQGVKIEYMIDFKLSFKNKVWPQLEDQLNIERYRTPVMRGNNPQMHNKIIIIDDEVVLTGSANYSPFGLVANYENIMAIREPSVIQKFSDELDELKSNAISVCEIFKTGVNAGSCRKGLPQINWDRRVMELLTSGRFNPEDIDVDGARDCSELVEHWQTINRKGEQKRRKVYAKGLFDGANRSVVSNPAVCFKDRNFGLKVAQLVERVHATERFVDGQLTTSIERYWQKQDTQSGKYRVYFSPEDNVEAVIVSELEKTLEQPEKSFAYVSTNFITNYNITNTLVKLHKAGVRLRVFFDRGRFEDDSFKMRLKDLQDLGYFGDPAMVGKRAAELGITQQYPADNFNNVLTVFDNQITTGYGSNHNKMVVTGTPRGLTLVNGSANWSLSAVRNNDENLVVIKDTQIASLYLKEILSQLYVYRYGQNLQHNMFEDEIAYLSSYAPCLPTLLSYQQECDLGGQRKWAPQQVSSKVLRVTGVPINPYTEALWAWVPQLNNNQGGAVPLYFHEYFGDRWVGVIPGPTGWNVEYKYVIAPLGIDPNWALGTEHAGQLKWETGGLSNRKAQLSPLALPVLSGVDVYGQF